MPEEPQPLAPPVASGALEARVVRDGVLSRIPAEQLVPGDLVQIEAGVLIPADGRLLRSATLEAQEAALTGESAPVPKAGREMGEGRGLPLPLADRHRQLQPGNHCAVRPRRTRPAHSGCSVHQQEGQAHGSVDRYTFQVRAIDKAGNVDPSPAAAVKLMLWTTEKIDLLSYHLKKSESATDGLVRVVVERIDHALELFRESGREDHEEAVHTVRKDLKKARSAVRLARSGIGEKRYRRENVRLGDAGRWLSAARDATVKKQTLEALREHFDSDLDTTAADAITGAVAALDPATVSPTAEVERSMSEAVDELKLARSSVMEWKFEVGGWRMVADGLDRTYRRGRLALADVAADPSAQHVHAWRKRVKDLWYQLRLLEKAWPGMIGGLTSETHELAELIGDHHDLALLTEELEGTSLTLTLPQRDALRELVERRQAELLGQALPLGGRMYAEKPKAFSRRLHTYWRIWRA